MRSLLSETAPADLEIHRATINEVIDRVLRRGQATELGDGGLVPIGEAMFIDHLAKYLDVEIVREEVARHASSDVSSLISLGLRLAELGHHSEARQAIHNIQSPEQRVLGLAQIVSLVPSDFRDDLMREIQDELAEVGERSTGEVESHLIELLAPSSRQTAVMAAFERAVQIDSASRRHGTLRRLAGFASQHLPDVALGQMWSVVVTRVTRRADLVRDLDALLPIFHRLGGSAMLTSIAVTLLDVVEWFP